MSNRQNSRNNCEPCQGTCWYLPTEELASLLVEVIVPRNSGKFTFCALHLTDGHFGSRSDKAIFISSRLGHEQRYENTPTMEQFSSWISLRRELLLCTGNYIGLYSPDGHYCLDLSVGIRGFKRAIEFAQANEQKEIYQPATDRIIQVPSRIIRAPKQPEVSPFTK